MVELDWSASSAFEVLGHRLCGEAEGSTTECLLDGLEVLRGGSPRADERIDFSRKRGYERCAPNHLDGLARRGEGSTVNCLQEGLEVLRIHVSSSEERVDIGLDRRLQRGEHLLEAPFFGRVIERSSQLRLGHGRPPPPEYSADQRSLNTPGRQVLTFLSCTLDKTTATESVQECDIMPLHSGLETLCHSCTTAPLLPLPTVDPDSGTGPASAWGARAGWYGCPLAGIPAPELEEHPLPHATVPLPEFPAPELTELPGPRVSAPLLEFLAPELDSGA